MNQRKPVSIAQVTDRENYCIYNLYFDNTSRLQAGLWRMKKGIEVYHVIESRVDGNWCLKRMKDDRSKKIFTELQQLYNDIKGCHNN
jgi:hypothetical protein